MRYPAHIELQAALDAERAKCVELQAEIERLRGLLSREQQERHAALAEVDRITEAGRVHIRRAAAFESERDRSAQLFGELSCEYEALQDECDSLRAETERLARQLREARAEGGAAASERAEPAADLEALVAEMLACLRLSRGNVASLGPAMAIEPHTPYRPWLAELDRVIAKAEGGAA